MATRGWEGVTTIERDRRASKTQQKYRNVRVTIDGRTFASKREAAHYQLLKAREAAGEIQNLRCQVVFPLRCPTRVPGMSLQVAQYIADFVYDEAGEVHIVDTKGVRTSLYELKAKWLWLQNDLAIEEV